MPRIIHVTSWLSRTGGGIPPVIRSLAAELLHQGVDGAVVGLDDPKIATTDGFEVPTVTGPVVGPRSLGWSRTLRGQISERVSTDTVLHVHGLWMYPGLAARRVAAKRHVPLVISPHGMLEPWALRNSAWKKKIAAVLFENMNLRHAACLHALCPPEVEDFRRYGLRNPIAVIGNGVEADPHESLSAHALMETRFPALKGRRRALFLSRIHPKKGLRHLLHAWACLCRSQLSTLNPQPDPWSLVIAGPDEEGHEAEMKSLARQLCLGDSIQFVGPLYAEDKAIALAGSDLFVLPSHSEGFSLAILEAAANGLPVILTPECNFPELVRAGGGIEVAPTVEGCLAGLTTLLQMSSAERREMGQRGKELVQKSYTWPVIGRQMLAVYSWLLGRGAKPDCVQTLYG